MYIYIYQYNTHGLVKLAKHIYINCFQGIRALLAHAYFPIFFTFRFLMAASPTSVGFIPPNVAHLVYVRLDGPNYTMWLSQFIPSCGLMTLWASWMVLSRAPREDF